MDCFKIASNCCTRFFHSNKVFFKLLFPHIINFIVIYKLKFERNFFTLEQQLTVNFFLKKKVEKKLTKARSEQPVVQIYTINFFDFFYYSVHTLYFGTSISLKRRLVASYNLLFFSGKFKTVKMRFNKSLNFAITVYKYNYSTNLNFFFKFMFQIY